MRYTMLLKAANFVDFVQYESLVIKRCVCVGFLYTPISILLWFLVSIKSKKGNWPFDSISDVNLTLFQQEKKQQQTTRSRVPFKFTHTITNQLKPIFNKQKMQMVFANNEKLKNVLGNTKDKCDEHQQSGIYKILCDFCSKIYIGQTRRNILTRYKEHCSHIKYNRPTKSAVAEHALTNLHVNITNTNLKNLKLVRQARSIKQLDILESIEIHKYKSKIMNNVYGPVSSSLFNFIKIKQTSDGASNT